MGMYIIGRPKDPYPDAVVEALKRAVSGVHGVAEAHIPQLFMAGKTPMPEQTLIIVPGAGHEEVRLMKDVMDAVHRELPEGPDVPAMLVRGDESMAKAVREAGCQIFQSETMQAAVRRWWQVWK